MLRDFFIVGFGSFLGGGSRFLVSKLVSGLLESSFPLGTFMVNLFGCLLIGFFSSLPSTLSWLSPQARLLLTTGFCGGLTTFSTFMNESLSLANNQDYLCLFLYLVGSFALGLIFVWAGGALAKAIAM
ncbi:MAG TPA: fluoride efflux transporter CrcB [Prevotella sp.]|nr:fluoride efflux transporter CrcB [Prevotella sp.]